MGLFNKNKIKIHLDKYNFEPGDTIEGYVALNLKKPVEARELRIQFLGERREERRNGEGEIVHNYITVFEFSQALASEGQFQNESFQFKIKIPNNITKISKPPNLPEYDGALGKLVKFSAAMSGVRYYPVEWTVKAQLDVPMKFDLKKEQKIIISDK